jgi:hypothetical protein
VKEKGGYIDWYSLFFLFKFGSKTFSANYFYVFRLIDPNFSGYKRWLFLNELFL